MYIKKDKRIVLTLDAGGTNFVFSAIQGGEEIAEPVILPASPHDLDKSLHSITEGFKKITDSISENPSAISFAFPGPADYPKGIIGDLANLPCFRGGVALGPMLEEQFEIPVFINNDGDLFVYGEAIAGFLPKVNKLLTDAGSPKRYKNLFGITLGTGYGGGLVRNGELYIGDNAAATEIWAMHNKKYPRSFAEEGVSIRAVRRVYAEQANLNFDQSPEPKDIHAIAAGKKKGDQEAAVTAFKELGEMIGDTLANAVTLVDSLIVIGGGLTGAHSFFFPAIIQEMNGSIETLNGDTIDRLVMKAFDLEDARDRESFLKGKTKTITVPGTAKKIKYDPLKRTGIGLSVLGTSKAVSIGAYAFALHALNKK
ncbi:MAG: ROK family protein [bacterium]